MSSYIDQTGHELVIHTTPRRIISLVPSQTELLHDLGLDEEVIGITRFCVHPNNWLSKKTKVGGTKNINLKRVRSLKPDLIIANKEENEREIVEELRKEFNVYTSDIKNIEDAQNMISDLGAILNQTSAADTLIYDINQELDSLRTAINKESHKALYLIWKDPIMVAGNDTYIHEMMSLAGLENMIDQPRYPSMNEDQLKVLAPQLILLSSEPYSFNEKHVEEFQKLSPRSKVILVDGEMFSWYGSRLREALPYIRDIIKQC